MKISVCMATYNGEKFIEQQINSILNQLGDSDELIISDDKSIDNTVSIIKGINDKRIKLIINKGEHGYTRNFENALKNAIGELIFLSDQDDIWLDDKISVMTKELQSYDFVVSDSIAVNRDLNVLYQSRFQEFDVKSGFINNFIRTRYIGCCMAFKRKVLEVSLPFPDNYIDCPHDYWVALVSELYFKTNLIEKPLILYRRHSSNTSSGGFDKGRTFIKKITGRIYCLKELLKLVKKVHYIKLKYKDI